jgi:hypothetical protein
VGDAEIYDPGSGTLSIAGTSAVPRSDHSATRLAGGRVLIADGRQGSDVLAATEVFDLEAGSFMPGPSMNHPRASVAHLCPRSWSIPLKKNGRFLRCEAAGTGVFISSTQRGGGASNQGPNGAAAACAVWAAPSLVQGELKESVSGYVADPIRPAEGGDNVYAL